MIKLFSDEELLNVKSRDLLPLQCKECNKTFFRSKNQILAGIKSINTNSGKGTFDFCSSLCCSRFRNPPIIVECKQCGKQFKKTASQIKKFPNHFCCHSCAATYSNKHKTKGTRRSKLEIWIEQELTELYPNLKISYNKKDAIDSELDIYIPSFNLAFELNGIFHYEPIYGKNKLEQIKNNDQRKFQACLEKNIELCIIDSSGLKYFKEQNVKKYLGIIKDIIEQKLVGPEGNAPSSQV